MGQVWGRIIIEKFVDWKNFFLGTKASVDEKREEFKAKKGRVWMPNLDFLKTASDWPSDVEEGNGIKCTKRQNFTKRKIVGNEINESKKRLKSTSTEPEECQKMYEECLLSNSDHTTRLQNCDDVENLHLIDEVKTYNLHIPFILQTDIGYIFLHIYRFSR